MMAHQQSPLVPYLLSVDTCFQVRGILVTCDQTDIFWLTMKDKIVAGEHNTTCLHLRKIALRPSIIDSIFMCLINLPEVTFNEMKMEASKWNKLAELLEREDKKTKELRL